MYFDLNATPEEIIAAGNEAGVVYDIFYRMESSANEFKRRQLPPN